MTTLEVSQLIGIPRRTLADWVKFGIIIPEGAGGGRRKTATWEDRHIDEIKLIMRLRDDFGYSMQKIRKVADWLRARGNNPFSRGRFVAIPVIGREGGDLIRICDEQEALSLLRTPGQLVFSIDIDTEAAASSVPNP